jgi:hypothetical protein
VELHDFHPSPNIRMIYSRRMGWVGHMACMEAKRNAYKVLVGKLEGRYHLETI